MKKFVLDYNTFINEGLAASLEKNPDGFNLTEVEKIAPQGLDRFRPNGDYSNRQWLTQNYEAYLKLSQSNSRFQIGDIVECIDPNLETYGKVGKIIAFEDNTIRWELEGSTTGVGQTSRQYRCHASSLMKKSE